MSSRLLNDDLLPRFRRNLVRWYERNGRDLPWRRDRDAYRIWISEIMLQQTTVAAVIPYYDRFLGRFPDVETLAAADEPEVLKLWEGLGYYSRARNIHATARRIVEEYDGRFPETPEELRALPGIGRYTAGAIASFAFDQPAAIVEANTLRLYCRLMAFTDDPRSTTGQKVLWKFAEHVLPRSKPGRFNQALMELGGTVCTVKEPGCEKCPVRMCCQAYAEGIQDSVPAPKQRPKTTQLTHANVLIRKNGQLLIRRHGEQERWAGLWDFPRYELDVESTALPEHQDGEKATQTPVPPPLRNRLQDLVREQTGVDTDISGTVAEIVHSVTRYRIRLICFSAEFISGRLRGDEPLKWVSASQLAQYPLSMTARKLANIVAQLPD